MRSEKDDRHLLDQIAEANEELQKHSRITYTRDFLLSLSELDVCKRLPSGFDQSIFSEFEDASYDRPRISGGLSFQNFRRSEYGSSPPTRGDSSNFSRGIHGRWDNRSSGQGDRDSDSQSDKDSDFGRHYGNQSRRSWQVPEHDGLLGSGSFPRPTGYTAGATVPKLRANEHSQLNKTSEPYHPPRPYKAIPHLRREGNDSYNNETFGSSNCSSEDRAEEERKRRVSFELMRKEQQKAFQEVHKVNPGKQDDFDAIFLLGDSKDDKMLLDRRNESGQPVISMDLNNYSEKSYLSSQTPQARPLVPPGFSSTISERNFGTKSAFHHHTVEEEKQFADGPQQQESTSIHVSINMSGNVMKLSSVIDVADKEVIIDSQLHQISDPPERIEVLENSEVVEHDNGKVTINNVANESNQSHSALIFEKLFTGALVLNHGDSSSLVEHHDTNVDGELNSHTFQSSKLTNWFFEEDDKPVGNLSSSRPRDLLSFIVGGEKGGPQATDGQVTEQTFPNLPFRSSELPDRNLTSNLTSATVENSAQLYNNSGSKAVHTVLTCEDLEQSILSEACEYDSILQPPVADKSIPKVKTEQSTVDTDDRASELLLSLLLKGTDPKDFAPVFNLDTRSSDKLHKMEVTTVGAALDNSRNLHDGNASSSGNSLSLETFFGADFMKEFHSVVAPVSGQRGPISVSDSQGLSLSINDDSPLPSTAEIRLKKGHEYSDFASNQRPDAKSDKTEELWLCSADPQTGVDVSQLRTEIGSKLYGFDGHVEVHLPEEDSLISVNDPIHIQNVGVNSIKAKSMPSPNAPIDIPETLANSVYKDQRSTVGGWEGQTLFRHPYNMREPDIKYQNLHVQPSSSQLLNTGQLFHPLDSFQAGINSQVITPSGGTMHHDLPNRQFPANMLRPPFQHPSAGLSVVDPSMHHAMLQQMHMAGNVPPPHHFREISRGAPMPHLNNQATGFIHEPNQSQGLPFGYQQPNFVGLGFPPPAPDVGGNNHPDPLQRPFGMDFRPNSQQLHTSAAAGHAQKMYGHEQQINFGYR